jgi:hypothetical protein
MLTKELEILIKSVITDNGFKYKKEIKGFSWTRRYQDRREEIVIGYGTFYPNMFQIYSPSVYIYFDIVENIIKESVRECNIEKTWGDGGTIHTTLNGVLDIDYNVFKTKISDENNFKLVSDEIINLVGKGAVPFFEKYNSLKKVHDYAITLQEDDYPNFFGDNGSFKLMIIKKLLNKTDYETYSEKIIKDWTQYAKNYPQYFKDMDKVVVELKNILDKL